MRYYVRYNELCAIIHEAHIATDHGGRNRIVNAVNSKYKNVNIEAINICLKLCKPNFRCAKYTLLGQRERVCE